MITHCFKCNICEKKISSISDVSKHLINLAMTSLQLELNMLRYFVRLNWKIDYSYTINCLGFRSPKAQIFQKKYFEIFIVRRKAKLLEYSLERFLMRLDAIGLNFIAFLRYNFIYIFQNIICFKDANFFHRLLYLLKELSSTFLFDKCIT